jgi:flagellar biosynthesis GTPase FlhF
MSSIEPEARTYFGDSLEELLPKIRAELGPDALIVRQREGVVGGIGGFFGRKCVEVEARGALVRNSLPPRAVIDAYDTGEPWEGLPDDLDDFEPEPEAAAAEERAARNTLLETLLAQTSPFAEELSTKLQAEPAVVEPEPVFEPEPAPAAEPPVPARPRRRETSSARSAPAPVSLDELAGIRSELLAAAVPVRMAGDIVAEVERSLRPFEPGVPARELARRALARRIPTSAGWRTKRRTVALVGLPGSGRTLAAAGLCAAYVRDGRSVTAISLEPARTAMRLAELTGDDVGFQIADAPDLAARVRDVVRDAQVVVADTPPLVDPVDGNRLAATLELLGALDPDETHLVLPATTPLDDARTLVESLAPHRLPSRLIVSHADAARASGVPVGLALAHRIPISFIGAGASLGSLRPAESDQLSRMVLQ